MATTGTARFTALAASPAFDGVDAGVLGAGDNPQIFETVVVDHSVDVVDVLLRAEDAPKVGLDDDARPGPIAATGVDIDPPVPASLSALELPRCRTNPSGRLAEFGGASGDDFGIIPPVHVAHATPRYGRT